MWLPLWNSDGTIGLLVPVEQVRGIYNLSTTFQGNIGAEATCITRNGYGVSETVPIGPITMGPRFRRPIDIPIPLPGHPIFDLAPSLKEMLRG